MRSSCVLLPLLTTLALAAACGPAEPSTTDAGSSGSAGSSAGGSTGGSSTGGASGAAGSAGEECVSPAPQAPPIEASQGAFSWVTIDGAQCANGTPTGLAVSPAEGAKRLFIYIMGGGACWTKETCYDQNLAVNISTGFGAQEFAAGDLSLLWFFNRDNADNPFAKDHMVFVPYCTGDIHSGTRVADHGGKATAHVGGLNMAAYLERLRATFPDVEQVVVSGGSAGGLGATLNWHRVKDAFPCARVDLIDDAAAALPLPYFHEDLQKAWRAAWGTDKILPPDCPDCLTDLSALYTYSAKKSANGRGAVTVGLNDSVVGFFFQLTQGEVSDALTALAKDRLEPLANVRYYYVVGDHHVVFDPAFAQNGVPMASWITQMVNGDPGWKSVVPASCASGATCQDCQTCALAGPCAAKLETCLANPECVKLSECAKACNGVKACQDGCVAQHPDGVSDATALIQCAIDACPGKC